MPYVALEWDHKIGKPMIRYVVVQCSGLGEKCGGPVALAPRRDVAYFCNDETAEQDAKAFAAYKNSLSAGAASLVREAQKGEPRRHLAYAWDHNYLSPLIRWGVLEWGGEGGKPMPRTDVGYFIDPQTAEADAKAFSWLRDDWSGASETRDHTDPASRAMLCAS
jgi:hypothetical protein